MEQNDKQLSALLKRWREIEPKANFEANVWRRLRLAQAEEPERVSVIQLLLRQWLWQPAASIAAAVILSVVLGSSLGVLSAPKVTSTEQRELGFLSSGSLAGGYLRVAAERER